ncbi:Glycosyltransferase involved in cell wall bisynthesis [Paenibacillus sp. UNCCL117]|uniref:glycosyltransferase family 2 protein n=1 Tax=unclassified Paenibacillus TaxID=185978 RepID=UPI00087E9F40|nr:MULTISPECIES: glycosyltransferase family 2 protein [unclassified Paenibacillus]SDC17317.1 Glycosyltransferase involved in cell wall bisynthesis [Paenibacillus sp. cl123]SFW17982.1 Glycosyltransferase involved in cell wall bisynthesis [Paenibacillus sp. UNCCL117]
MYTFGGEAPFLTVVVPCYNEESVLHETTARLAAVFDRLVQEQRIAPSSIILYVDDGSKDGTWTVIDELSRAHPFVRGLKLSRNAGHQNALLAGLHAARACSDCVISIDADLQDDVTAIRSFIYKFHEGYDVVYGVRENRRSDTFFKRNTAVAFYRMMKLLGVNIVYNHADYRLLSHRALVALADYKEVNLFLRGIMPLVGFRSAIVRYDRHERYAGDSKYNLRKMLLFALEGITSFSVTPIRMVTASGFIIFILSIVAAIYSLVVHLSGHTESGWTSLILSIWFIGGVQLMSIGLLGEYIGKIYLEVKGRPLYTIEVNQLLDERAEHAGHSRKISSL